MTIAADGTGACVLMKMMNVHEFATLQME